MSKGRSFEHRVRPIEPSRITYMLEYNAGQPQAAYHYRCRGKRCVNLPTHYCTYHYITGSRGKMGRADRMACAACARKFAAKYNVSFPEGEAPA